MGGPQIVEVQCDRCARWFSYMQLHEHDFRHVCSICESIPPAPKPPAEPGQCATDGAMCHAIGCDQSVVQVTQPFCSRHWAMVPAKIKRDLRWHHYPGQETEHGRSPSAAYIRTLARAVLDVDEIEHPETTAELLGVAAPAPRARRK